MNIWKDKFTYLILGGIGIGAGLAYLYFKTTDSNHHHEDELAAQLKTASHNDQELLALLQHARQAALADSGSGNYLQPATIYSIQLAFSMKCGPNYLHLRQEGRDKRRAVLHKNMDEYIAISNEYSKKIDDLLSESIEIILQLLGVPDEYWKQSIEQRSLETGKQFGLIGILMLKNMKLDSTNPRLLKKQDLLQIYKYQLEQLPLIDAKSIPQADRAFILRHIIADLAAMKFGVEDQDLTTSTLESDPEVISLKNQLEDKIDQIISSSLEES